MGGWELKSGDLGEEEGQLEVQVTGDADGGEGWSLESGEMTGKRDEKV